MKAQIHFLTFLTGLFLLTGFSVKAHNQSSAYLNLRSTAAGIDGEWHVSLRDLDDAVGLDANDDGVITWGELQSRQAVVSAYLFSRLHLRGDGKMAAIHLNDFLVDNHSDGSYAVLRFAAASGFHPASLEVNYNALFDIDPKHRGLFRLEHDGVASLAVFSPATATQSFDLVTPAPANAFRVFLREGVWHIWSGYDHILFLLALLLPGVLRRREGHWQPVADAKPAFLNVLKIVTSFTAAHSITLSLAALGLVHLPARFVESAIAGSVIIAAANNLVPFFSDRGWLVAFGFGLLHGFGFANALSDLGLRHGQLAGTLFGFNLGVEFGQLAIVAVFLPLALSFRHLLLYQRLFLRAGSVAIMAVASTWLAERVLDFKWLPF